MHSFTYRGLKLAVFDSVYEPAEDSFMLAKYAQKIHGRILEIGCGTGIVALSAAKTHLKNEVLGIDINNAAVKNARYNAEKNKIKNIRFKRSNLFSTIKNKKFDYILCNPPYVPTNKDEKITGSLNHAFDGGKDGRKILDQILWMFENYLEPHGRLILIHSSLQDVEKTRQKLVKRGYTMRIIDVCSFFFEKIFLIEIVRGQAESF